MPYYSWSFSGSLSFSAADTVFCIFDSGENDVVSTVSATLDATNPVHTDTYGIYAHFYAAGATVPIDGTGYFVLGSGADPDARGFETPAYGSAHWLAAGGAITDPIPPHARVQVYVYPRGGGGFGSPKTFDLVASGAWSGELGSIYCSYGTRLQAGQQIVLVITEAVIGAAAILTPELAVFAAVWGAFVGWTFVPGEVCGSPPPTMPVFTDADFLYGSQIPAPGSIGKFWTALQAALWPMYCECLPATGGSPPAVPYPIPTVPAPPSGIPLPPAPIVCDANDICTTLNGIVGQLRVLSAQVSYVRSDVQLIQRQGVPFGYLAGTVHSGLSGQGQFAVSDILGLAVTFTTLPGTITPIAGDPLTYHQVGKISIGTADGWTRSWQPTHSPYLILPVSGAFTLVGWTFAAGVVATITELVREP